MVPSFEKGDERKLLTTEMRMLRIICGKILKDGISNHTIRNVMRGEDRRVYKRAEIKMIWAREKNG